MNWINFELVTRKRDKHGNGVDYLDGFCRGPYRWLLTVSIWKLHLIIGGEE